MQSGQPVCSGHAEGGKTHPKVNRSATGRVFDMQEVFLLDKLKQSSPILRRRGDRLLFTRVKVRATQKHW